MFSGLLEVSGTIDLSQFWPEGESDADTVKVLLSGPAAFRFRDQPGASFKVTQAFEGAIVRGRVREAPIDNKNRITVRLQGVDAPELHFRPVAPTINGEKPTAAQKAKFKVPNGNFRQHFGETSTTALHDFLSEAGAGAIPCVVRTAVDEPSDVFDTFGRFIGDIFIQTGGEEQDVNHWLAANGWAFPTFYSSMSSQEINDIIALTEKARKAKAGIWKRASSDLTSFDRTLLFRSHGQPDPLHDPGLVILSKLFRRRSTFGVATAAKLISGSLKNYLKSHPDHCFHTDEFLVEGPTAATPHTLDEFVSTTNIFSPAPKDLVFKEDPAQVLGKNGKPAEF